MQLDVATGRVARASRKQQYQFLQGRLVRRLSSGGIKGRATRYSVSQNSRATGSKLEFLWECSLLDENKQYWITYLRGDMMPVNSRIFKIFSLSNIFYI